MFNLAALWFVIGMFVAGSWIIVGSLRPAPRTGAPLGGRLDPRRAIRRTG